MSPIQQVEAPQVIRTSKYDYPDADVDAAAKMLADGGTPGDGPFKDRKEGKKTITGERLCRSKAARLVTQLGGTEFYKTRAWEGNGGWYFNITPKSQEDGASEDASE